MSDQELVLSFDGVSVADANRFAAELAEVLRDADEPIEATQTRDDPNSQDFGATLLLVLGSTAVVALAKGVAKWLAAKPDGSVTIRDRKSGEIIAKGLTSRDARAVIEKELETRRL
jgi:hypothetical protein